MDARSHTVISTRAPCVTDGVTLEEATKTLQMPRGGLEYRRLADIHWGDDRSKLITPEQLQVLDRVFRGVQPRTIISLGSWEFSLIVWLFCPSADEICWFSSDVRGEIATEILNEVLFHQFILGDPAKTLPEWKQGAELAWCEDVKYLDLLGALRPRVILTRALLSIGPLKLGGAEYAEENDGDIAILTLIPQ